jgi:flagellar basal body-associated protein FliL
VVIPAAPGVRYINPRPAPAPSRQTWLAVLIVILVLLLTAAAAVFLVVKANAADSAARAALGSATPPGTADAVPAITATAELEPGAARLPGPNRDLSVAGS